MDDVPDYDLHAPQAHASTTAAPAQSVAPWIVAVASLILIGGGGLYLFLRTGTLPARQSVSPSPASRGNRESAPRALGGEPDAIVLPPLDQTDPLVRRLVRALSTDATIGRWLVTEDLIRSFTVAVANVADGTTPAKHLAVLKPAGSFSTIERSGVLYVDPRSYGRYDALAHALGSVDPIAASRLYATLKPRIEDAFRELGTRGTFDQTLARAITILLETPAIDGPIELAPKGIGYGYADARLEGLADAQRQLLRMGPMNVRTIQRSLRDIALALGIPNEELPGSGRAPVAER